MTTEAPLRRRPSACARLALWAIRCYQRHLSPRKGFSCAYRVHRGGASCSAHGYRMIQRHGLALGLALLRRRLRRCGEAHEGARSLPNPVLRYQRGECDLLPCDCHPGAAKGALCELGCQGACDYGCNKVDRWLKRWLPWCGRARNNEARENETRER